MRKDILDLVSENMLALHGCRGSFGVLWSKLLAFCQQRLRVCRLPDHFLEQVHSVKHVFFPLTDKVRYLSVGARQRFKAMIDVDMSARPVEGTVRDGTRGEVKDGLRHRRGNGGHAPRQALSHRELQSVTRDHHQGKNDLLFKHLGPLALWPSSFLGHYGRNNNNNNMLFS